MRHWLRLVNRRFRGMINRRREELRRFGRWHAWGFSFALHVLLLGALAVGTFGHRQSANFIAVLADWAELDVAPLVDPPLRLAVLSTSADNPEFLGSAPGGREGESGPVVAGTETAAEQASQR